MKLSLKLLAALVSASFCLQASAATVTVINTSDSGAGSLRQAISDSSSGDTIDFDSSLNGQTITLTSGELVISTNLTITGPGANLLAINGNAASGVFDITSGIDVTISGLTITNGNTGGFGGGILNYGTLEITNTTLSGNSATSQYGGGIFNGVGGTLTITNSTLSGNSAFYGAGIYNADTLNGSTLTITNSTLSGNSAGFGGGGGIYNEFGTLTITNSTLSGNSADNGGGIRNAHGTLEIGNTILKNDVSGGNILNYDPLTSDGYNLSSDGTGPNNGTTDQINTDPLLGPLQNNGGSTFTHALLVGSPAIDAGDPNFDPNSFTPPLTTDQRGSGFPRVASGRIDIGAFEVQALNTPASDPPDSPVPVDVGTVGSATDITLTFPSVTAGGMTTVMPIADPSSVGPLPTGIDATNALAFDITTTAKYTTPIIIAVQVLSISDQDIFSQLQVLHWNGTSWDNVTASDPARDWTTKTIYASVSSLSPFVIATETLKAQVQQPINSDGSSVFSVKRGVVPVVFTLTSNGVATCQLPPAKISVIRTAGTVVGSIDESTYRSKADKGSNFRISNCQYVYNLGASSLGTGTYEVNILIGGTVVGSGTFALK